MEKNNYEHFDEQLDRYLRHEMTPDEERNFKELLESDNELKERASAAALMIKSMFKANCSEAELTEDQRMVEAIRGMDEAEFRRIVRQKPKMLLFRPKFIAYAAAACIACVIAWTGVVMYSNHQIVALGDSQYMAYVQDISDTEYMRGTNDTQVIDRLQALFRNVKDGTDIKHTIAELEPLYRESLNENSDYNTFCEDIAWNLAIAYLKDGNREKPIPILQGMIDRNADYPEISQPAKSLIEQIRKL